MFFDVETTGLPNNHNAPYTDVRNWPRIVSICWVVDSGGTTMDEFYSIVRPEGFVIPPDSSRIHGITTSQAEAEGVSLESVFAKLNSALSSLNMRRLVAHNMSFDKNVLLCELHRKNHPLIPSVRSICTVCTKESSTDYCAIPGRYGRHKWPTLEELYRKLFGSSPEGQHNAKFDVAATRNCYYELVRRGVLREDNGDGAGPAPVPVRPRGNSPFSPSSSSVGGGDAEYARELCEAIIEASYSISALDPSMAEDVLKQIDEKDWVSDRQIEALERIADAFRIDY